jgi:hypothetical protein
MFGVLRSIAVYYQVRLYTLYLERAKQIDARVCVDDTPIPIM